MGTEAGPPQSAVEAPPPHDAKWVEEKDGVRETLETIAFVVFLVLLLKAFVAEAFVIPTGSMATTLFGDHSRFTCDRCRYPFTVNNQLFTQGKELQVAECPNCHYRSAVRPRLLPDGGDKVLVLKPQYDLKEARRHDVIVFKFPGEPFFLLQNNAGFGPDEGLKRRGGPQEDFGPKNFIKRLWGKPGEMLAIWQGDVYLAEMGEGQQRRIKEIIRRDPSLLLVMRRIVNDNDFQAPGFTPPLQTRWRSGDAWLRQEETAGWKAEEEGKSFKLEAGPETRWLRYRHIVEPGQSPVAEEAMRRPEPRPTQPAKPRLITDFLEYNEPHDQHNHWVGDLMVEAEARTSDSSTQLIFELRQGIDRHQAIFDSARAEVRLTHQRLGREMPLKDATRPWTPARTFRVRFANFDQRLTLWVDGKLIFGDGVPLPPMTAAEKGPRLSDLFPVSIGASGGGVSVGGLKVFRDIYYTQTDRYDLEMSGDAISMADDEVRRLAEEDSRRHPGRSLAESLFHIKPAAWDGYYSGLANPNTLATVRMAEPTFYPVQHPKYHPSYTFDADEYFALGDNSVQSKDSRYWGQVPERLLMGKAVWVYWPWNRWFLIR